MTDDQDTGSQIHRRLTTLRRVLPVAAALVVLLCEMTKILWLERAGQPSPARLRALSLELFVYGVIGPATVWLILGWIIPRTRADETLRESEEKYRTLFETMAQGVVYQAADGEIISANPAAERILGLTLDQMQGRTSVDPRWRAIHEDGTRFPGDAHPSMVVLSVSLRATRAVPVLQNPSSAL